MGTNSLLACLLEGGNAGPESLIWTAGLRYSPSLQQVSGCRSAGPENDESLISVHQLTTRCTIARVSYEASYLELGGSILRENEHKT